jgi:hypothetical protein
MSDKVLTIRRLINRQQMMEQQSYESPFIFSVDSEKKRVYHEVWVHTCAGDYLST